MNRLVNEQAHPLCHEYSLWLEDVNGAPIHEEDAFTSGRQDEL